MAKVNRVGLLGGGGDVVGGGGAVLPPVIRRPRECGLCFQNSECMLYHRASEGGDDESSGLDRGVFDKKVGFVYSYFRLGTYVNTPAVATSLCISINIWRAVLWEGERWRIICCAFHRVGVCSWVNELLGIYQ